LLLEYDKFPVLTVEIKPDKEKGESVVNLFDIFAKDKTLGIKFEVLLLLNVLLSDGKPSYVVTIEEEKLVPTD
jgi:Ca2+-binding EF-hand superfamily protein